MKRSAGFFKIVNSRFDRYAREEKHIAAKGKCRIEECTAEAVEVVEFFFSRVSSLALCREHADKAKGKKTGGA